MAYELQTKLLEATNGGLDIIKLYYPQIDGLKNGKFSIRDERTPSASLKQLPDKIWVVTDFGGDQQPRNGVMVAMHEENLTYREAMAKLTGMFGVGGIKQEINKPGFEKRPAKPDEEEGQYYFEYKDELTESELRLLGPKVTHETCKRFHLFSLASFIYIKNREAFITSSNDNYPILIFKHAEFEKIYQPLSFDKQYRFRYVGNKPKDYINGLDQLKQRHKEYNTLEEKAFVPNQEQNKYKEQHLDEAIIVSGERDALNVAGLGYSPIWFNSETAKIEEKQLSLLHSFATEVYLLPDIDDTGIKSAIRHGMQHLDLKIIRLPESLKNFKDSRGKMRKDFRDYIEIYPKVKDFKKLLDTAMSMRFYDTYWTKGYPKYKYNPEQAANFLQSNGFWTIENRNLKDGAELIRINGNIVTPTKPKDIKGFMRQFCIDRFLPIDVRNLVRTTTQLSDGALMSLAEKSIDFTNYEHDSQFIFFRNKTLQVSGKEIKEYKPGEIDRYVWEEEVIDHNFKLSEAPFKISQDKEGNYDIEIKDTSSKFFCFLINASRMYWREELEERTSDKTPEEIEKYTRENKFNIAGPNLQPDEIQQQKQHLINKLFALGYILHRYKDKSKPWAIWAMDNKISPEGESHGRSGKSFCWKTPRIFMKSVTLPGRNPKLTDNPHIYDRVTEHTKLVIVDDADQNLNFKFFFDSITGEFIVNPKNNQSYEIPQEISPKFVFTSNFVLRHIDPSTAARLLYTVFSDYYHERGETDEYKETRKVSDDFGKNLFESDYTEQEWNADYNLFMHILRFYLSVPGNLKVQPPMDNVHTRQLLSKMGDTFKGWAETYFNDESGNADALKARSEILKEFVNDTKLPWSGIKFTKALTAFCEYKKYTLNPKAFQNSDGRIVRKVEGKATDMVYIQTKPLDPTQMDDSNTGNNTDDGLPF